MKFIENNVELVDIAAPGKKIEIVGRVCYKSDNAITNQSYEKFIKYLVERGHTSVLEAERRMLAYDLSLYEAELKDCLSANKYFTVTVEGVNAFISANIRAWYNLVGNLSKDDSLALYSISSFLAHDYPYLFTDFGIRQRCLYHKEAMEACNNLDPHKEYTFKIICSRACSHQLVRHRTLSFAQQSQRYCNYTGDKFGNSISFIKSCVPENTKDLLQEIENTYFKLIENKAKPEDARQILPNCTATEICITGTKEDWKKFCALRSDSHAQKEIREISDTIKDYLKI